jgi:hypothetical protein
MSLSTDASKIARRLDSRSLRSPLRGFYLRMSIVFAVVAAAVVITAAPAVASSRRCARVGVPARQFTAKVLVRAGPESCVAARALIKVAFTAESTRKWDGRLPNDGVFWQVSGFKCEIGLAGSQTFCTRARERVDGSLRSDDGWTF